MLTAVLSAMSIRTLKKGASAQAGNADIGTAGGDPAADPEKWKLRPRTAGPTLLGDKLLGISVGYLSHLEKG